MSDVANAPAPPVPASQEATPGTASNEVPINPNPVNPPSPIDSQPPAKTEQSRSRPSRLETIQEAFKKSERERPKPQPAKAEMGHNKPPEPMEEEEKFDLRRRPKDQPRERGKFVARAPEEGAQTALGASPVAPDQQPGATPQPGRQVPQLPPHAPYRDAPPRMADHAKAEWAAAPESVRGEVYRMHKEFNDAYQRSHADVQEMEQIRHFQQLAKQHGTTLLKALTNYTGMEELLRTNLVAGLDLIVNNLKLENPERPGQRLNIRDVAYHILNQTPEQHQMLQSQNTQMAQSHQLAQANQRIAQLEQQQQQAYAQQHFVYNRSAVDAFAAQHPRFDEISGTIYEELLTGRPLNEAYRRADLLNPPQAAQTRTPTAQTRPADRSISGAPDGGSLNGASRAKKPVPSIHEAVTNAVKQVRGSM